MKKKRGFTLVEMMAVIAILGLLVLLVLPNVLKQWRDAKKVSFIDEAKIVYTKSTDKFILEKTKGNNISYITNKQGEEENTLDINNEKDLEYEVRLNNKGGVEGFKLKNNEFCIVGTGDFLNNYTKEEVMEIANGDKEEFCVINSFGDGEELRLTLSNENDSALSTKQSPSRITIKYGIGMYKEDASELQMNDLEENYILDTIPTMKNNYFLGYYGNNDDGEVEVVDCDGTIKLDNYGLPLFSNVKVNSKRAVSKFEKKYYELAFDGLSESVKCEYGSECSIITTVPTKTGYKHIGWSKIKDSNNVDYSSGQRLTVITDDNEDIEDGFYRFDSEELCKDENNNHKNTIKLYPAWDLIEYKVKYNCNSGSGNMGETIFKYNESKKLKNNSCIRNGYDFLGWSRTSSDSTPTYINEAVVKNLSTTDGEVIELYAVWSEKIPDIYAITLNNEDANTPGTSTIYEKYGDGFYLDLQTNNKMSEATNKITIPKKEDYNFLGYYTQENGKGTKVINADGSIDTSVSNKLFNSNKTIYAYWEENIIKYTITLNNEGANTAGTSKIYERYGKGFYIDTDLKNQMSGTANKINLPQKNNHKFLGYFTQEDGKGTKVINADGSINTSLSNTLFSSNSTIYANWEITSKFAFKYTKKFTVKDGSNKEVTYNNGGEAYLNGDDWYVKFLETGVLTVYAITERADIFLISGGNAGGKGNGGWPYCAGGTGGKGGIWYQKFYITIPKTSYTVTIGGQSAHSRFVSRDTAVSDLNILTSDSTSTRKKGGTPAKVNWDCKPVNAGAGEDGVYPFADTTFGYRYGAGGGGGAETSPNGNGSRGNGGADGGAKGCTYNTTCDAKDNTGGGGGGGFGASDYKNYVATGEGGKGGSGIVILRRSKRVTVTFDANGGKIAKNATQNFYHGKTGQKFADTGATNGKKTLLGWALTADAKEARYKVNSGVIDSWILNNRPKITLYAVWK